MSPGAPMVHALRVPARRTQSPWGVPSSHFIVAGSAQDASSVVCLVAALEPVHVARSPWKSTSAAIIMSPFFAASFAKRMKSLRQFPKPWL